MDYSRERNKPIKLGPQDIDPARREALALSPGSYIKVVEGTKTNP